VTFSDAMSNPVLRLTADGNLGAERKEGKKRGESGDFLNLWPFETSSVSYGRKVLNVS